MKTDSVLYWKPVKEGKNCVDVWLMTSVCLQPYCCDRPVEVLLMRTEWHLWRGSHSCLNEGRCVLEDLCVWLFCGVILANLLNWNKQDWTRLCAFVTFSSLLIFSIPVQYFATLSECFLLEGHLQPGIKDKSLIQTRDKWDPKQCLQFQHF